MTAEEIRATELSHYDDGEYFEIVLFLREIAAQLAEMNERADVYVSGAKADMKFNNEQIKKMLGSQKK